MPSAVAIAAITDAALGLAFVKALPEPERYREAAQVLEAKAKKIDQRRAEAKAHDRNRRTARVRSAAKKNG